MSGGPISRDSNSKMREDIRVVPWYNTAQFKKVYECLYSTELVKKRWAVDQISVWETRCHPSLPTAIEASLVIVRAIIQDILLTNGASLCQERDIQMMYSMALVRFVNLTIEAHQSNHLVTSAQIAKGFGIPSWIVDLRNEATHSFTPSLPSLRLAAETAMKYLNESFWEKEISALKNFEKDPFDEEDIRRLIYTYITIHFNILRTEEERGIESERSSQDTKEIKTVLLKLSHYVQKNKRRFVNILISDGLFIPYDDELKNVMSPTECLKYEETFDEAYENRSIPPAELSIPPVPVELEDLWKRMLHMLNSTHTIPVLLEALLKSLDERSEMGKKLVIAWAIKIVDCEGSIKKLFKKQGLILNWYSLFNAAVSQPCIYTPYIFCRLYSRLDLKKSAVGYILYLLSIAIGHAGWDSMKLPNNHPVYTVDDLKQMKKLQNGKKEKSNEENIWSVVEDSSYKSWPIGFVSHRIDDSYKAEDQSDDFIPLEYFEEKMDFTEKYFILNKNDNEEEEDLEFNQSSISEDEMEISERQTFLYKMK